MLICEFAFANLKCNALMTLNTTTHTAQCNTYVQVDACIDNTTWNGVARHNKVRKGTTRSDESTNTAVLEVGALLCQACGGHKQNIREWPTGFEWCDAPTWAEVNKIENRAKRNKVNLFFVLFLCKKCIWGWRQYCLLAHECPFTKAYIWADTRTYTII